MRKFAKLLSMLGIAPSIRCRSTGNGAKRTCPRGWAMAGFEYRQATEIRDALALRRVRYIVIGKSAAILLGFPDTTQAAVLFDEKAPENGRALADALRDLG